VNQEDSEQNDVDGMKKGRIGIAGGGGLNPQFMSTDTQF